ncbi:MAG: hypothetical protein WCK51_09705 [Armatimonadota bacterium]
MNNHNEPQSQSSGYLGVPSDEEHPFFSDAGLERRIAYSRRQALLHANIINQDQSNPFKNGELRNILKEAKLTRRQYEVIKLRARGLTFEEIGKYWNRTKQGAQRVYQQAVRKLQRARRVYPFTGLNEVYRQEIHRGGIR